MDPTVLDRIRQLRLELAREGFARVRDRVWDQFNRRWVEGERQVISVLTACLSADRPAVPTCPWRLRRGRMIVRDGSGGRDVDRGAPGAARAGPEGAGGGVRGGGDRGVAGAGRPAAERAGDAGPARGRRDRLALAGGRPWRALPAG